MPVPLLGMLSTGLNLFGGISGLIGASNAEHQAEVAAQNAIRDYRGSASAEQRNLLEGGTAGLENLSGGLNNALVSGGRNLGAALAGAGINNSTAAAGALANQAGQNAGVEGRYSSALAQQLLSQTNQTNEHASQMGYGLAVNNMNYAREQQAGAVNGLSQFFGNLGQMNFGQAGGNRMGTQAPETASVLSPTAGPIVPVQNPFGLNGNNVYGNGTGPGQLNSTPTDSNYANWYGGG